jgi:mannose-6-phosphate isomerase-like protein (cupin superfamily)
MFVARLADCPEFLAGDHTHLRELLHPAKHGARVSYSVAHGWLAPGERSKRHVLSASEVYYFLAGTGDFRVDGAGVQVGPGTLLCVPPRSEQWVENTGPGTLEFLCLVEPAWTPACEEVVEA